MCVCFVCLFVCLFLKYHRSDTSIADIYSVLMSLLELAGALELATSDMGVTLGVISQRPSAVTNILPHKSNASFRL